MFHHVDCIASYYIISYTSMAWYINKFERVNTHMYTHTRTDLQIRENCSPVPTVPFYTVPFLQPCSYSPVPTPHSYTPFLQSHSYSPIPTVPFLQSHSYSPIPTVPFLQSHSYSPIPTVPFLQSQSREGSSFAIYISSSSFHTAIWPWVAEVEALRHQTRIYNHNFLN